MHHLSLRQTVHVSHPLFHSLVPTLPLGMKLAQRLIVSPNLIVVSTPCQGAKLAQRLAAAEEQYDAGLRKLTATAKELASLQKRVRVAKGRHWFAHASLPTTAQT